MEAPGGLARRALLPAMVVLTVVAWTCVWQGAGMGMRALDMTVLSLFPHLEPPDVAGMPGSWMVIAGMWLVMMVAMMLPSALPLVMLGGRVMRHYGRGDEWAAAAPWVAAGYLLGWMGFALVAAGLQQALAPSGVLSPMLLWSRSAPFSASLLAIAGAYQLSPLKDACLAQCRSPASFLMRHWRTGRTGGLVLGMRHGAWCIGCCWPLMCLLFVFGVMNLFWIALLSLFVLAEKLVGGTRISRVSGILLLAWAAATLVVDASPRMPQQPPQGTERSGHAAAPEYVLGEVLAVDRAQGIVELRHGPIATLGMPAMTMQFRVRDAATLAALHAGDPVRFRAALEDGMPYVTEAASLPRGVQPQDLR